MEGRVGECGEDGHRRPRPKDRKEPRRWARLRLGLLLRSGPGCCPTAPGHRVAYAEPWAWPPPAQSSPYGPHHLPLPWELHHHDLCSHPHTGPRLLPRPAPGTAGPPGPQSTLSVCQGPTPLSCAAPRHHHGHTWGHHPHRPPPGAGSAWAERPPGSCIQHPTGLSPGTSPSGPSMWLRPHVGGCWEPARVGRGGPHQPFPHPLPMAFTPPVSPSQRPRPSLGPWMWLRGLPAQCPCH